MIKTLFCILFTSAALNAQTLTLEADPDFYFDRGITFAAGIKPQTQSRWTFLGEFASRKVGPLDHRHRLQWRIGPVARYRLLGSPRANLFADLGLFAAQFRANDATVSRGASLRPGLGLQWFPWQHKGFYFAPQGAVDRHPGRHKFDQRIELRIGWQH